MFCLNLFTTLSGEPPCGSPGEPHRSVTLSGSLCRSEAQFRALIENALDLVSVLDGDGRILYTSPSVERILGYPPGELAGADGFELVHPEDLCGVRDLWDRGLLEPGAALSAEYRARRCDGSWRVLQTVARNLLHDPAVRGVVLNSRDVTERHEAEERLRFQSLLLDSVQQAVIATDLEGRICYWNRFAETLYGWAAEQVHGRSVIEVTPAEGWEASARDIMDRLRRGDSWHGEFNVRRRDGSAFPAAVTNTPVFDGSGQLAGIVGVSTDISERKRTEEVLRQAYEELRRTQQAALQQERLRALGQMASGIAHDINNSLSPIVGFTDLLLLTEPNLSARTKDYLHDIHTAGTDIAHIVARMREFYRKRDQGEALQPVRLNEIVSSVIDLTRACWRDIPQQNGIVIDVALDLDPWVPLIRGTESELREALTNLVFNAVDAMPEGGTLRLSTSLRLGGEGSPDQVVLGVRDTGHGMDEAIRQHCLEPFFTTKGERGTGLGLAMVFGVMQRHEGIIEVESEPGGGTCFRLLFPVAPDGTGAPAATEHPGRVSPLRLLYVDDEPMLRKLVVEMLREDRHQVTTADGGGDGIRRFEAARQNGEPFDAVITDLGMPGVDGAVVARTIKAQSPGTPVILLTGWGTRVRAGTAQSAPADLVLPKPPTLRRLREALLQVACRDCDSRQESP